MHRECPQCHSTFSYWDRTRLDGIVRWCQAIPYLTCRAPLRSSQKFILAPLVSRASIVATILGSVWRNSLMLVTSITVSMMIYVIAMN
jgi:predicted neutral ceramidase superfamily lipid hydrolase